MAAHLILYDGACGFCRRAVEWVRRRDAGDRFDALAYQDAPSPPMTAELRAACARAVHVVTADGRRLRAGRASLFVLGEIGWPLTARALSVPPLSWAVELAYWIVARNRSLFARVLFRTTPR